MLDWRSLYYGHVKSQEVAQAVKDHEWQALRRAMKGKSLESNAHRLSRDHDNSTGRWPHRRG